MLGRRAETIIATAYIHPDHDLSYQHATFAEHDNAIIGMASGYTAEQHRRSSDEPLRQAAGYRGLRMLCVAMLCAPLLRFLDNLPDGDFYLQAIAVDPRARGGGVGSALINFIEERARSVGSSQLTLDVAVRNEGARKLYRSRGMSDDSKSPNLWLIPRSGVIRMKKTL